MKRNSFRYLFICLYIFGSVKGCVFLKALRIHVSNGPLQYAEEGAIVCRYPKQCLFTSDFLKITYNLPSLYRTSFRDLYRWQNLQWYQYYPPKWPKLEPKNQNLSRQPVWHWEQGACAVRPHIDGVQPSQRTVAAPCRISETLIYITWLCELKFLGFMPQETLVSPRIIF